MPKKKTEEVEETVNATPAPADETAVETAASDEKPKKAASTKKAKADGEAPAKKKAAKKSSTDSQESTGEAIKRGNRAEKIGVVASDKMTKTVVVRVDRLVKHPVYRKYVRKRKKFMAHDETGAKIGDKVRIVETRPMSARKRWRVVEIIQKAEL